MILGAAACKTRAMCRHALDSEYCLFCTTSLTAERLTTWTGGLLMFQRDQDRHRLGSIAAHIRFQVDSESREGCVMMNKWWSMMAELQGGSLLNKGYLVLTGWNICLAHRVTLAGRTISGPLILYYICATREVELHIYSPCIWKMRRLLQDLIRMRWNSCHTAHHSVENGESRQHVAFESYIDDHIKQVQLYIIYHTVATRGKGIAPIYLPITVTLRGSNMFQCTLSLSMYTKPIFKFNKFSRLMHWFCVCSVVPST